MLGLNMLLGSSVQGVTGAAYDLILVAADSYGVGINARAGGDVLASNVYQFNGNSSDPHYRTITQDLPLSQPIAPDGTSYLSIAEPLANAHAARTGNPTIIIPYSYNGTKLLSTGHVWQVGDTLHEGAITQANLAIAAAVAARPGSKLVAIALLDSGLANDAINYSQTGGSGTAVDKAATKTMLGTVIADFRSRITGASSVPILFHAFPPEFIASYNINVPSLAQPRDFCDAIREYAAANTGIYFVDVAPGTSDDNLHLNNAGVRLVGPKLDAILADTTAPVISTPNTFSGSDGAPINISLTANEYVTWSTATSGWEIIRTFGTGGTGGINTAIPAYTLRLTSNANASYSSPPANPVIVARDGAGNTTSETITVTIAQPYGVGDQGPVTATYTGYVQNVNSFFGGASMTFTGGTAVPLGAGLNLIYPQTEGGSGDISGITVNGTAATQLVASTTGPNGGSVWGLIMAAAGSYTATVTQSGGNGAVVNPALTVVTMTGTKATTFATDLVNPSGTNHSPVTGASETCPTSGMIVGLGYIASPSGPGAGCTSVGSSTKAFAIKRTTTGALSYAGADGTSQLSTLVFEKSV